MVDQKKIELEEVMKPLQETLDKLLPLEEELKELKRKFDETESTIFSSQILPLEFRMQPLQQLRDQQQEEVLDMQDVVGELEFERDR